MVRLGIRAVKADRTELGRFRVYVAFGNADVSKLDALRTCPGVPGRFGTPYAYVDAKTESDAEIEMAARLQEFVADTIDVLRVQKGGAIRALLRSEADKGTRRTRREPV